MMTKEWKRLEKGGKGWISSTSPDLSTLINWKLAFGVWKLTFGVWKLTLTYQD